MQIDLLRFHPGAIPDSGLFICGEVPSEQIFSKADALPEGVAEILLISIRLDVTRVGLNILVKGTVCADVRLSCDRCAENYEKKLEDPTFQYTFVGVGDDCIDLSDAIREAFVLALPLKHLCRPDCAGCCPVCGTSLNAKSCTCETSDDAFDSSPWNELDKLNQ